MSSELNTQTLLFVTGRLAESSLREVVRAISDQLGFNYNIVVPGIQVAALLHVDLLLKRLEVPEKTDRVILPGWVQGNIDQLQAKFNLPFERGPKDLRDLPEYFGLEKRRAAELSKWSIEIIAEINHATRQSVQAVVTEAQSLISDGADLIDIGCVPGESSSTVGELVTALRAEDIRVSIDSFDRHEVDAAVNAGAELILSGNSSNIDWVGRTGAEVVLIPDSPQDLESLDRSIQQLCGQCEFRIDPILEPIGMGFTSSLQRYILSRQRYPDLPIMMGTGNVTELADSDSGGINMLLAAVCQDLQIHSILTTQVINWCRTSVREFNAARRMVQYAEDNGTIPKHISNQLLMLRDARPREYSAESLEQLSAALTDSSFRIFAEQHGLHLMNRNGHWQGDDSFEIFAEGLAANPDVDASHAFYLGYEMARAEICRLLGKKYDQDEPIQWGVAGTSPGSRRVHHESDDPESETPS